MKRRPRPQVKLPWIGVKPQEAACRLAACQLNGHLRGGIVFIDADASTAQLLSGACLGKLHESAHQVAQAVEGSLEQCANPSDFTSGSLSEHAASDRDLNNASQRPAIYREGGRGLAGGAHVHGEIWGATCEVGKLGSMPIALPALQTARLVAQPGIAFARSATETMRRHDFESAFAEGPQQHMQAPKPLRQHRRLMQGQQPCRKGRHADGSPSIQQGWESGKRCWLLSLEEAFFMQFALACLTVSGSAGPCTTQELWEHCIHLKQGFAHSYLAFHHFRSKGWVVRPGADYGADFVLYKGHPCEVHSSYCVLALTGSKRPEVLRWTDIEAASRVCSEASKKLLLLYVFEEPGASTATLKYLSAVSVEERLVQRWIPGKIGGVESGGKG